MKKILVNEFESVSNLDIHSVKEAVKLIKSDFIPVWRKLCIGPLNHDLLADSLSGLTKVREEIERLYKSFNESNKNPFSQMRRSENQEKTPANMMRDNDFGGVCYAIEDVKEFTPVDGLMEEFSSFCRSFKLRIEIETVLRSGLLRFISIENGLPQEIPGFEDQIREKNRYFISSVKDIEAYESLCAFGEAYTSVFNKLGGSIRTMENMLSLFEYKDGKWTPKNTINYSLITK